MSKFVYLMKVLLIGAVLYFLGVALHETGHMIVAWVTGTHIESFRIYDPAFGGSVVQISGEPSSTVVSVGNYFGGSFAGAVILGCGLVFRKSYRKSALRWMAGLAIFEMGFWQLSLGITEGLWPSQFGAKTGGWWDIADIACAVAIVLGIVTYLVLMRKEGSPLKPYRQQFFAEPPGKTG